MLAPVVEVPSSAPPVALKMPVGLPLPSPTKKASSSFAPILLANSFAMYDGKSNTESLRSSSEILIAVPSLYAESDACPNVSSEREYCCSSSIQTASPLEVTIGILRSPLEVLITVAIWRKILSSSNSSTSFRS